VGYLVGVAPEKFPPDQKLEDLGPINWEKSLRVLKSRLNTLFPRMAEPRKVEALALIQDADRAFASGRVMEGKRALMAYREFLSKLRL
jgi:hypothetical protein